MPGSNLLLVTVGISMLKRNEKTKQMDFFGYPYLRKPYSGAIDNPDAIEDFFYQHFNFAEWISLPDAAPPPVSADPVLPGAGAELRLLYFAHPKWLSFHDENRIILLAEDTPADRAVVAAIKGALKRLLQENKFPPAKIDSHFFSIAETDPGAFLTGLEQLRAFLNTINFTNYNNIYFGLLGGKKGMLTFLGMYYLQCRYTHQNNPDRFKGIIYLFEKANIPIIINADNHFHIFTQLGHRSPYPVGPGI